MPCPDEGGRCEPTACVGDKSGVKPHSKRDGLACLPPAGNPARMDHWGGFPGSMAGVAVASMNTSAFVGTNPSKRSADVSQREFAWNTKSEVATRDELASHFGRRSTGPVIGSKHLLCVELFAEVVRMCGRTNAASVRDFQNRSSWHFPRLRSGQPPSSAVQ